MVNEAFEKGVAALRAAGIEDARLEAGFLWDEGEAGFADRIARRIAGEPLQYLVDVWEFYGFPMRMREGVLIARPDTECLVEQAEAFLKTRTAPVFLEIGCGSGAVSVALCRVTGAAGVCFDVNEKAVALTRANAGLNGVPLRVLREDLFGAEKRLGGEFDLILSNPPYLNEAEMKSLQKEVRREPQTALYGGADGLAHYRYILPRYAPLLKDGGAMMLEIGDTQAQAVCALAEEAGYTQIRVKKDYGGRDRIVLCRKEKK